MRIYEEKIYRLIQQGAASWSGGKPEGMPDRVVAGGASVSDAVVEDRRRESYGRIWGLVK